MMESTTESMIQTLRLRHEALRLQQEAIGEALSALYAVEKTENGKVASVTTNGIKLIHPTSNSPADTTAASKPKKRVWTAAQKERARQASLARWAKTKGTAAPATAAAPKKKAKKKAWTPEQKAAQAETKRAWWAQRRKDEAAAAKKATKKAIAKKAVAKAA